MRNNNNTLHTITSGARLKKRLIR